MFGQLFHWLFGFSQANSGLLFTQEFGHVLASGQARKVDINLMRPSGLLALGQHVRGVSDATEATPEPSVASRYFDAFVQGVSFA